MSEGEFKKRAVHEAVIDLDDIKQFVTEDKGLIIEIPDEKYLVKMKDLFEWLDEAAKEYPHIHELPDGTFIYDAREGEEWFKKWFPH